MKKCIILAMFICIALISAEAHASIFISGLNGSDIANRDSSGDTNTMSAAGNVTALSVLAGIRGQFNAGQAYWSAYWYGGCSRDRNPIVIGNPVYLPRDEQSTTPEPMSMTLLCIGLAGLAGMRRKSIVKKGE